MKTTLTYSLLLPFCLLYTISYSQTCTRQVTAFMAAPGGYSINGSGVLESSAEGNSLYLDSAFSTQSGPDLHVYLAIHFEAPSVSGNTNIDLGPLTSSSGAQSYTVPSAVSLEDYDYVLIHCKSFNHWWGGGELGEVNCVSATNTPDKESFIQAYPNPATNVVTMAGTSPEVDKIFLMDITGRIRMTQSCSASHQQNIDISELENGLFFVLGKDATGKTIFSRRIMKM